jgi:pimeloyl-ACP methyl ester carboxylesterase
MKKRTAVVGLGTAALAGMAVAQVRSRIKALPVAETGRFANGMEYAKWGDGPRTLLWIPGGPGSDVPHGVFGALSGAQYRPLLDAGFTVWFVTRRRNMPDGHTVSDMADDYAQVITQEFQGRVDLLVADSQGGVIGFALAATHPHLFGSFAAVAASHTLEPTARDATLASARLLSQGRRAEAAEAMVKLQNPWLRASWLVHRMAPLLARVFFPAEYDRGDVLLAAQAVDDPALADILPTITVPVLLVCGDRDHFVSAAQYEQTAHLIPDCTLTVYSGKGHLGVISDPRLVHDILNFAARLHPAESTKI